MYFFLSGLVMGMWATGLPTLYTRLALGPAQLGTALLLISAGALVSMLIGGRLVDRWSSRIVCRICAPLSALALLGPALAPSYAWLAVFAVLFGIGLGFTEVAMNVHSVEVERRYGRPIISAFHGFWSMGGAVGGVLTAAGLKVGADGQALLVGTALVVPFLFLAAATLLLPAEAAERQEGETGESAGPGRMSWTLIGMLGAVAFAAHLSEGAAIDWAALHARLVLAADPAAAPLAYTIFAVAMTTVRLFGDPIRARFGSVRTIQFAGAVATFGYVLVLLSVLAPEALRVACAWGGWALVGIGLATVIPVVFSAVGAAGGGVGRALSLVTALGYMGLLLGPALLGYVAEGASLTVALIIPTVLAAVIALAGVPTIRVLNRVADRETAGAAAL